MELQSVPQLLTGSLEDYAALDEDHVAVRQVADGSPVLVHRHGGDSSLADDTDDAPDFTRN